MVDEGLGAARWRSRSARLLGIAGEAVAAPWAALALFVAALGVYALEALAWPVALTFGRDSHEYVVYYLDFLHSTPLFPQVMLTRTPIASLVLGALLDGGGPRLAEVGLGVAFAGSVVAYSAAALQFGRVCAVLTALALLAWPPYGSLFHQIDSDGLFAFGFALWTLWVVRSARRPSAARFAVSGLAVAALVLTRPSSQLFLLFAVFPLVLSAPWRTRLRWSGAFLAAAVLPIVLWAGVNDIRYDDFTLSRLGWANIPFFRVLAVDRLVRPENGPASRELARAIQADLLDRQPYRAYHIDLERFLDRPPWTAWWDLVALSDRTWGWSTDGRKLFDVALEAVRAHPGAYALGVAKTLRHFLDDRYVVYFDRNTAGSLTGTQGGGTIVVAGRRLPARIVAPAIGFTDGSRPDGKVLADWSDLAHPRIRFPSPSQQRRLEAMTADLRRWERPPRQPSTRVANWLNFTIESRYPRLWVWLVVAIVALLVRRPRGIAALLALGLLAAGLVVFNALSFPAIPQFVLPVAPVFVLLAFAGLVGRRGVPPAPLSAG